MAGKEEQGIYCFLDGDRVCSADCAAYLPEADRPRKDAAEIAEWEKCLLLLNVQRTGKHLVVLAQNSAKRPAPTPPPPVR